MATEYAPLFCASSSYSFARITFPSSVLPVLLLIVRPGSYFNSIVGVKASGNGNTALPLCAISANFGGDASATAAAAAAAHDTCLHVRPKNAERKLPYAQ